MYSKAIRKLCMGTGASEMSLVEGDLNFHGTQINVKAPNCWNVGTNAAFKFCVWGSCDPRSSHVDPRSFLDFALCWVLARVAVGV
eukprot:4388857-Amphidinium_carterae.1